MSQVKKLPLEDSLIETIGRKYTWLFCLHLSNFLIFFFSAALAQLHQDLYQPIVFHSWQFQDVFNVLCSSFKHCNLSPHLAY